MYYSPTIPTMGRQSYIVGKNMDFADTQPYHLQL